MKLRALGSACLLALCLVTGSSAHADTLTASFTRANRAFSSGDYAQAVREYERLLDAGVADPDVTFNLASAYAAQGQYGQAIRYYERTLRLEPGDLAAEKALGETRSALAERTAQLTGEAIVSERGTLAEALFSRFGTDGLAWALLLGSWLLSASALGLIWVRSEAWRLALGITCGTATLLAAVSGFGLGTRLDWGRFEGRGVVIVPSALLREGPAPSAQAKLELTEGSQTRIVSREGAYLRVQSGSQEGYLLAAEVGEI